MWWTRVLWSVHIATLELPISGSEVARRFHIDRSPFSRAAHRVLNDPDLTSTAEAILTMLLSMTSQR
jgi:hypothetical protein